MSPRATQTWNSLERWSSPTFLVAGGLALGYAAIGGYQAVIGRMLPSIVYTINAQLVFLSAGVGLLCLYPRLRESVPRLSFAAASVTALAELLLVVTFSLGVAEVSLFEANLAVLVFSLSPFVSFVLGFFLFGVAGLRSAAVTRRVAGLLLVPFASWSGYLIAELTGSVGDGGGFYLWSFLVFTPVALALLGLGYLLRPTARSHAGRVSDATTR